MLIRPQSISGIQTENKLLENKDFYRNVSRKIVFIEKTINGIISPFYEIMIENKSLQIGSVGCKQSVNENLYTINTYFGTVANPFVVGQDGSIMINRDAEVLINPHVKVKSIAKIDKFKGDGIGSVSTFSDLDLDFESHMCDMSYSNNRNDRITACDCRFYNLDDQMIGTGIDDKVVVDNENCIIDVTNPNVARYRLGSLFDSHTTTYTSKMHFDNSIKLVQNLDPSEQSVIDDAIFNITRCLDLLMPKKFTCSIDRNMFYIHIIEFEFDFEKKEMYMEAMRFKESLNYLKDILDRYDINIRIVFGYLNYTTLITYKNIGQTCSFDNNKVNKEVSHDYQIEKMSNIE